MYSMKAQQNGAATGSQPIRSEGNPNVIGGWLPSLSFALGAIRKPR